MLLAVRNEALRKWHRAQALRLLRTWGWLYALLLLLSAGGTYTFFTVRWTHLGWIKRSFLDFLSIAPKTGNELITIVGWLSFISLFMLSILLVLPLFHKTLRLPEEILISADSRTLKKYYGSYLNFLLAPYVAVVIAVFMYWAVDYMQGQTLYILLTISVRLKRIAWELAGLSGFLLLVWFVFIAWHLFKGRDRVYLALFAIVSFGTYIRTFLPIGVHKYGASTAYLNTINLSGGNWFFLLFKLMIFMAGGLVIFYLLRYVLKSGKTVGLFILLATYMAGFILLEHTFDFEYAGGFKAMIWLAGLIASCDIFNPTLAMVHLNATGTPISFASGILDALWVLYGIALMSWLSKYTPPNWRPELEE